ncbi:MAG: 50S ribosomal protein L3 [Anaerohalosphaeraceae bacterium]|nr:50S ribosomal protein L3 [Anaerohalosphaeraceae bacterium]
MVLLGKKIGMTRIYDKGKSVPVTVIQAGPCSVTQIKTDETDGYNAVQVGYDDVKPSRCKKPAEGHAKKAGTTSKAFIRELRLDSPADCQLGDTITVDAFADIKFVDVVGTSKGKGYAGVMKRHGFGGFPASHGCERKHRAPGSISSFASDAGHGGNLKKGKRMAGRMGGDKITSRNHDLIGIDAEKSILIVKGAVPGCSGGYVVIKKSKKN